MIAGSNIEISNRLTPVRRPGLSVYNSSNFNTPNLFYEFRRFSTNTESIVVMVDTAFALNDGTGPGTHTTILGKVGTAGQSYMQDIANVLYFGNGLDTDYWWYPASWAANTAYALGQAVTDTNGTFQWLTQVKVGSVSGGGGGGFSIADKVVSITFAAGSLITPGMSFIIFGFSTGTYLNGVILHALNVNGNVVTAFFDHIDVVFTADTSSSVITNDVGTFGTSGNVNPTWSVGGTTTDNNLIWVTAASPSTRAVFAIGTPGPIAAPGVSITSVTTNAVEKIWQPSTSYRAFAVAFIVDSQNQIWQKTVVGTSGSSYPIFPIPTSSTSNTLVQDGSVTWRICGWLGSTNAVYNTTQPSGWRSGTATLPTPLGSTPSTICVDSHGNLQAILNPADDGTTGALTPTWATTYGSTTVDNTATWTNLGPYLTRAFSGWKYGYAYYCLDGSVSTLSPLTGSTFGVLNGVQISGNYSFDPQVVQIWIFRTPDGGSIPEFLTAFPNANTATWTFNDQLPDQLLNFEVVGPQSRSNDQPPFGFINLAYHLNRLFGSVGNVVYWSGGPDTLTGNGNTAFPPDNSATFPSRVTRLVPTASGLFVFTISDIYILTGMGTISSPIIPLPYASGIGLLSYNALAVNGSLIYLMTADSQVIALDPSSGISQIGFPIGDQFEKNNWDPAKAYVTWHVSGSQDQALYVADGTTGWFRMTPTASPETGLTWSPFATVGQSGIQAVQSIEVTPGVHKLLIGGPPATAIPISQRDLSTHTDGGFAYKASFTIGSIVLAQPGQIAELAFVTTDANAVGSQPQPGVLLDEISGIFQPLTFSVPDPPQLPPSQSTYNQRFYFSQTLEPSYCRHMQLQINWPAEDFANELFSVTVFGGFAQEI